ncbi:MAG: ATP-binding cassette domain-containing protein [Actinomycetia bacterium]|nr:ATP-binding cassette domain-containing protein [Actinomycetes bacterium]
MTANPVFHLEDVSFNYSGGRPALNQINLSLARAEKLVILGPNGCGKSTLLKIFDGLLFPTSGSFTAFGQTVTEEVLEKGEFAADFRRWVAFVFQDSDIQLFSSTVLEEVSFGPLQLDIAPNAAVARAEEILKMLDLIHLKDSQPHQLSGGEKKKVALASSLATGPEILLADEPTNNLDPRSKSWLVDLLNQLGEAGKTIVLATQDLEVAAQFATRAVILDQDHKIVADGSPADLLADKELLEKVNLIHEHWHEHGDKSHQHEHTHRDEHDHDHTRE